jgi:hypothetical protein
MQDHKAYVHKVAKYMRGVRVRHNIFNKTIMAAMGTKAGTVMGGTVVRSSVVRIKPGSSINVTPCLGDLAVP